jgi:hypothetical protein
MVDDDVDDIIKVKAALMLPQCNGVKCENCALDPEECRKLIIRFANIISKDKK